MAYSIPGPDRILTTWAVVKLGGAATACTVGNGVSDGVSVGVLVGDGVVVDVGVVAGDGVKVGNDEGEDEGDGDGGGGITSVGVVEGVSVAVWDAVALGAGSAGWSAISGISTGVTSEGVGVDRGAGCARGIRTAS